jgi:hypothetical protein
MVGVRRCDAKEAGKLLDRRASPPIPIPVLEADRPTANITDPPINIVIDCPIARMPAQPG